MKGRGGEAWRPCHSYPPGRLRESFVRRCSRMRPTGLRLAGLHSTRGSESLRWKVGADARLLHDLLGTVLAPQPRAARVTASAGPVTGSAQRGGLADTVTGTLVVLGTFKGSDSLMTQVETKLSMAVHGPGVASSGSCEPVKTTIKAARVRE